jgi:hypothetical protein
MLDYHQEERLDDRQEVPDMLSHIPILRPVHSRNLGILKIHQKEYQSPDHQVVLYRLY